MPAKPSDARSRAVAFGSAAVAGVIALGVRDWRQHEHSVLRNFPVIGHARWAMEAIRPEIQQYFVESSTDGRPFDRDVRSMVYQRAKGISAEDAFGTERDIERAGYDHLLHSTMPLQPPTSPPRVRLGGPDCTQPYDIAILNVSSMSFGALSANAVRSMNYGAAHGGFSQETGEGGLTKYHLEYGADIIWEFGSGYFGCRTSDGHFNPDTFAEKAALPQVKGVLIKLSQGAKPGLGGVLPGKKVTAEIAAARDVPVGEDCISPAAHSAFATPVELMQFVAQLRTLSNGKPIGIKFCVGNRVDVLAMCKAMIESGNAPDWITVDGAEGGTGAAPLEFLDNVGTPLTEGLVTVHNALVGAGLRDRVRIGASGKIAGGNDIIRRMALGADFCNSARAMMMATGCIQAQKCNTNACPVGVATQNPRLSRAVVVSDKGPRVANYQRATVQSAMRLLASMGLTSFADLGPQHVVRRIDPAHVVTYEDLSPGLSRENCCADRPTRRGHAIGIAPTHTPSASVRGTTEAAPADRLLL